MNQPYTVFINKDEWLKAQLKEGHIVIDITPENQLFQNKVEAIDLIMKLSGLLREMTVQEESELLEQAIEQKEEDHAIGERYKGC